MVEIFSSVAEMHSVSAQCRTKNNYGMTMNCSLYVSQTTAQNVLVQKADARASEAIIQIELRKHKQPWNSFAALVDSRPQQ